MLNTPIQSIQLFLYTFSLVLATAAIACRLFARRFTRTKLQWNDWLMILAYLHVLGLGVAANIAVVHGEMGAHQSEIPRKRLLEVFPLNMKMTIIVPFLLSSSSFLVKMSITHFYIVLFPHTVLTRICKGQLCLLTICWLGGSIPFFFTCKPLAYTWNKTIDGSCTDPRDFWLGMSITALFFDLTCVILPIPVVWRLQCSIGKKIRLTLLFGLGLFICIITILRIAKAYTLDFADLTHSAATAVMCAVPEPVLSIVAGCIPITMPLFRHTAHKLRGRTATPRNTPQSYESRTSGQKAPWHMDKHKRLEEHLYPLGSIGADEGSASMLSSPVSARLERSIESLVGLGRLEGRGGLEGGGITVLREVHVDSERVERECV